MICLSRVKYRCIKSFTSSFYTASCKFREWKDASNDPMKPTRVWRGMTIYDLADSMRKDSEYISRILKPSLSDCIDKHGRVKSVKRVIKFLAKNGVKYEEVVCDVKVQENVEVQKKVEAPKVSVQVTNNELDEVKRPPVVAIMGHVDHGKTTLLDALRNSNIAAGEAGGITQHIGAFSVSVTPDDTITFIDTPGHAAFRTMRNHGAQITDIVVLIVAADDGVMEQTVESIRMAQSSGAKIIVAINKIDKAPEKNMDLIKNQLLEHSIQVDELGGDVQVVGISALKKMNLDKLMEAILLEAEMMDLKSDPDATFEGVVIESFTDKQGKFATVLVRRGTLRKRATLLAGTAMGKVKFMFDENGEELAKATLSQPVRVGNWDSTPSSGERVVGFNSEKEAYMYLRTKRREELERKQVDELVAVTETAAEAEEENGEPKETALETSNENEADSQGKEVVANELSYCVIVKGDTDGSVRALLDILDTYDSDKYCKLKLISYGVGSVTENDIKLAEAFGGTIYCFNIGFPDEYRELIAEKNIKIKFHSIIYKLLDDLRREINAQLPEVEADVVRGTGEVLQHFLINEKKKKVPVAGCICLTGEFVKSLLFRVQRGEEVIYEGPLRHLKHFKNYVNSIKKDQQCGIMFNDFEGVFETGDKIICFEKVVTKQYIPWDPGF